MGRRKKILVTGANGYIGRHVLKYLSQNPGNEIIAVDITDNNSLNNVNYIKFDFLNSEKENIYEYLNCPDIVIHLAWKDSFNHKSESHLKFLNNHFMFIKTMIDSGCESISVMGSMHEIGYLEGEINSDTPCNPISFYGIAKNALRQACLLYTEDKNVSFKWLRGFYITGDDEVSNSVFSKILKAEKDGKAFFPLNSGENMYDFTDINTLSEQIVKASLQNNINGIINCCSGKPVSLKNKVENFIKENKLKIRPQYGVYPSRKYDSPCIYGNPDLINKILEG